MFTYGTQYLRGATPEPDQWEKDIIRMKELGFNTIRAWLVWNAIERQDGVIDREYLTKFLSLTEKHGMRVGLLFHLHAAPAWAIDKYPEYYYVDENGHPFRPAARANTPSGGWPGLCFDHDEVRELEKRFIENVIAVTKNYSCVEFYEPMNEPHQWVDIKKGYDGSFCYCEASVKKYQKWLEKKYKEPSAMNAAWGTFYNSFDEVFPPRWVNTYGDTIDFRKFTMENIAEEIAFRTSVIKANDTKPVIAHAWGGGMVTCANIGGMAFDDWKNARVFDKWGFSAFPQSADECTVLGLGCNATRCAADGKEYWQSELGAGMRGVGLTQNGRLDSKSFAKIAIESIRYGAKGLLYWQFRKERIGLEFGGFAMTDYDGGDTNLSLEASRLCKAIAANERVFESVSAPKAEVALILSVGSMLADWCCSGRISNKFSIDSISGYYKMFWEENIPVDILHEEFCKSLDSYKVILLPSPFAVSEDCAKKLKDYVKNGGTVISDPYFGAFDKDYKLSYHVPGMGFGEVFGVTEDDMRMQRDVTLSGEGVSCKISGNLHRESFKEIRGTVLYTYEDGTPAIVKNCFGKGTAVISGINLGLTYSSRRLISDDILSTDKANESLDSKKIVLSLCGLANGCDTSRVNYSFALSTNGGEDLLYIINNNVKEVSGSILSEKAYSAAEVIYGECGISVNGKKISFTLPANETVIVRIG